MDQECQQVLNTKYIFPNLSKQKDCIVFRTLYQILNILGQYDPNRPDGPDYSTSTLLNKNNLGSSSNIGSISTKRKDTVGGLPLNIGLDVYPINDHRTPQLSYDYDEDSHQVKLHLNLYSDKPQKSHNGKLENIALGPFSFSANG